MLPMSSTAAPIPLILRTIWLQNFPRLHAVGENSLTHGERAQEASRWCGHGSHACGVVPVTQVTGVLCDAAQLPRGTEVPKRVAASRTLSTLALGAAGGGNMPPAVGTPTLWRLPQTN